MAAFCRLRRGVALIICPELASRRCPTEDEAHESAYQAWVEAELKALSAVTRISFRNPERSL